MIKSKNRLIWKVLIMFTLFIHAQAYTFAGACEDEGKLWINAYQGEGELVETAACVGEVIGIVPAVIIGVPVACITMPLGVAINSDALIVAPLALLSIPIATAYIVGFPFHIAKKLFGSFPKKNR